MHCLRFLVRLPFVLIWLVTSLFSVAFVYPLISLPARCRMNEMWSGSLMRICGVQVCVVGSPPMSGAALWVANHVSWIDIFILSHVRCVAFIAKSEIRAWPVIGWLVEKAGTLFINRSQRNSLRHVGEHMKVLFDRGQVVGLFAEGTTSTGLDVLPFHTSLFEPPLRASVDIQPVALRFYYQGQRSERLAFVGDESLVHNLWVLMGLTGVKVEVEFLPVVPGAQCVEWGRARVANEIRQTIRDAVVVSREQAHQPDRMAA